MSKITREQAIRELKEVIESEKNPVRPYLGRQSILTNLDLVLIYLNQQPPQLSDDVDRILHKLNVKLGEHIYKPNGFPLTIHEMNVLEQHIQAQASEIEELKKYKAYALSVGSVQSSRVPKLQSQLNAIREVVEDNTNDRCNKDNPYLEEEGIALYKIKQIIGE